ncbi:MAG TPA: hypothetical protein ENI68_10045 [Gammaproteobacteria bacterium]|nr:hypothetical protein [Gammaproteobacteria bacterium]
MIHEPTFARNIKKGLFHNIKFIHRLAEQITFLNEVVDYLVKNGVMESRAMFDTPFTHINDQGVIGVFGEGRSRKIIELIRHINANAGAA